jgi:hypothetical protein
MDRDHGDGRPDAQVVVLVHWSVAGSLPFSS